MLQPECTVFTAICRIFKTFSSVFGSHKSQQRKNGKKKTSQRKAEEQIFEGHPDDRSSVVGHRDEIFYVSHPLTHKAHY